MIAVYGTIFIISLVLLGVYCMVIKKKEPWILTLFASISVVQLGYLLLASSKNVEFALFANKITYFGQILVLISMLISIVKLSGFKHNKKLPVILIVLGIMMFLIVCTSGYLPWYYKDVWLEFKDGAALLVKEYGPFHDVYLVYVITYFIMMIATIVISIVIKKLPFNKNAGLLASVVLCNIFMWIIEKFVSINFEFLSVSYLLSEGMLFFLYWLMQDYIHINDITKTATMIDTNLSIDILSMSTEEKMNKLLSNFDNELKLSNREVDILKLILQNRKRKEIADELHLSENTIKTYTRTLYNKLEISNREELYSLLIDKNNN